MRCLDKGRDVIGLELFRVPVVLFAVESGADNFVELRKYGLTSGSSTGSSLSRTSLFLSTIRVRLPPLAVRFNLAVDVVGRVRNFQS